MLTMDEERSKLKGPHYKESTFLDRFELICCTMKKYCNFPNFEHFTKLQKMVHSERWILSAIK